MGRPPSKQAAPSSGSSYPYRFKPPPIIEAIARHAFCRAMARQKVLEGFSRKPFPKGFLEPSETHLSSCISLCFCLCPCLIISSSTARRRGGGDTDSRIVEKLRRSCNGVRRCKNSAARPSHQGYYFGAVPAGAPHWQFYASSPAHFITPGRTQRPSRITGRREAHLLPEKKTQIGGLVKPRRPGPPGEAMRKEIASNWPGGKTNSACAAAGALWTRLNAAEEPRTGIPGVAAVSPPPPRARRCPGLVAWMRQ